VAALTLATRVRYGKSRNEMRSPGGRVSPFKVGDLITGKALSYAVFRGGAIRQLNA
jgi:hypothetical protein